MNTLQFFFTSILNMGITAAYVALIVILARFALRKVPKIFSYALWSVVLFRLICPLSITTDFSLLGMLNMDSQSNTEVMKYVPNDIGIVRSPTIQSGISSIDNAVNSSLPQAVSTTSVNPMQIWMSVLSLIWLTGMVAILAYSVISYIKIKRRLQTATHVKDNIYESDRINTAFVCGFIYPKIYVPVNVGDADLHYILEHERTHIRRKDYLIKPFAFFALILHWFNPLMWLSFALMSRDMEMSCDESVLRKISQDDRGGYSSSLLSLSVKRSGLFTANPLAFGESHVRARIKNILNYKKPAFWMVVISVITVIIVGIILVVNPVDNKHENNKVETIAVKALKSFYGYTDESIVIYEQIPFVDGCMLVLADRLTEGEHYPNLYLVSPDGIVLALTRHSNCWVLNFTQLSGYKIFFGLAERETYQGNSNSMPISKIEVVIDDKIEAVKTRENVITHINPMENDTRLIKSRYAYILAVKDQDMIDDMLGIYSNGQKVSLSQISIDRNQNYMPEYLKTQKGSLYNSFAFTYSPMLSPIEWEQVDSEKEIGLKGKTDENGNMNAISFRPSQTVLKTIHSSEFPYDIKAFYLSNSFPFTTTFAAGESVEVLYSKETNLYDCRVLQLTSQSIDMEIDSKNFQLLQTNERNQITLPKEPGYYLFLLRTEKNFELRSYMGVISIQ